MEKSESRRATFGAIDAIAVAVFLRRQHPVKTAQAVAALGIAPARTVQHWLAGSATPSGLAILRLVAAYGPDFLAATVPGLAWVEIARAATQREALSRQLEKLDADLATLTLRGGRR